jgi:Repeat of unknown function (DUF5648)
MAGSFFMTTNPGVAQAALSNEAAVEGSSCGNVFTAPDYAIPLFDAYNPLTKSHFYTPHIDEYDDAVNDRSHDGQAIAGYCFSQPQIAISVTPVFRGYNPKTDDHLYVTDRGEIDFLLGTYQFEGIAFYVFTERSDGHQPFYRLRDPTGLHHFYTADPDHYAMAKMNGFQDEGILGYVFFSNVLFPSSIGPLYEAYNPNNGSHFYTMDFNERNNAINRGMRGSGIACYIYHDKMQPNGAPQMFRAYSVAQDVHLYTISQSELDFAVKLGFKKEGITGWVVPESLYPIVNPTPPTPFRRFWSDFTNNFLVPSPVPALASFANYTISNVIDGFCLPIRGLSVEIDILEDIVCSSVDQGAKGFSFQLNCESISPCQSPALAKTGWQQYVISLWGPSLIGVTNNWIQNSSIYSIWHYDPFVTLPDFTLAKGWKLTIALVEDESANIIGVTYSVFNAKSDRVGHSTRMLSSIQNATALGVAPIGSFQVVLVGPINGEDATLSSGRGTFTYTSSTPMRPGPVLPACVAGYPITGESANSIYGLMPAKRDRMFVQEFSIGQPGPKTTRFTKWFAGVKTGPPLPPPLNAQALRMLRERKPTKKRTIKQRRRS